MIASWAKAPFQYRENITDLLKTPYWIVRNTQVAGASFRQENMRALQKIGCEKVGVILKPEPNNPYDQMAIAVVITPDSRDTPAFPIGYVPRKLNEEIYYSVLHNMTYAAIGSVGLAGESKNLGAMLLILQAYDPLKNPELSKHNNEMVKYHR
jgi:hypothetical protein